MAEVVQKLQFALYKIKIKEYSVVYSELEQSLFKQKEGMTDAPLALCMASPG